jgi:hypothetical protein
MEQPIFTDLEHLYLISIGNDPIHVRYVGKSKEKHLFEPVNNNFGQRKKGSKLIFASNFHFGSDKIQGKRAVVID